MRIAKTSIKSTLISYLHNKKSELPLVQEWQRIFSIQLPSERTRCIVSAVRTCAVAEAIKSVAHTCVSIIRVPVVSAIYGVIGTISSSVCIKCISTAKAIAARIISAVRICVAAVHAYVAILAAPFSIITPRSTHSGYVLIVVTCFIPIVLLGIRYAEKLFEVKDVEIKRASTEKLVKQCAREASLAVARNWNPGLTLGQQRDGIYKVADAVYNAHPCYHDSPLGHALPGMVAKDEKDNVIDLSANQKTVSYKTDNTMYKGLWNGEFHDGIGSLWNVYFGNWRESDLASESERRVSVFDELDVTKLAESNFVLLHHDIREDPHPHYNFVPETYPTDKYQTGGAQVYSYIPSKTTNYTNESYLPGSLISGLTGSDSQSQYGKYAGQSFTYSSRLAPSGTDYVEVSVENDKIKVRTDTQEDYAIPARCNVDIVLAVPVNGAASNIDGLDYASDTDSLAAATDTTGSPYKHYGTVTLPEEVKKTPIYQMGQALKNFVKEHFYHTRGVNMSLIPYSGKLSISPDRATSWTVAFPQFVDTSLNTQLMIGACLYGTSGVKDATLKQSYKTKALVSGATLPTTNTPYYWGGVLTGCPIMFRAGTQNISTTYGGNSYFNGFMLYTDDPSKGDSYKYLRMNLNPCYMGYANMLSMRCEKQCTHFLPNPYYMIEPTSDLVKIYEMCNALYPIYDTHNVSNFVFAALEWANNMFQSWTNDPSIAAKDGSGAGTAGATSDATLSRPSKTTSGRKKAVILLVNKPDWFEPGEMTYLGFNNDFSEVPTVLSDKIDFSIDYSDTSKKFLDGSSYNTNHTEGDFSGIDNTAFLAAGANKILKFEHVSGTAISRGSTGYYESTNGTHKLTFPHKGLIKLVVAPIDSSTANGKVKIMGWNLAKNVCKLGSTSGSNVSIGTWLDVMGEQTYVFPGPPVSYSDYIGHDMKSTYSQSSDRNFSANLSIFKVAFYFDNAEIVDATLKNQTIRNYVGMYSQQDNLGQIILNNGRFQSDTFGSYRTENQAYRAPLATAAGNFEADYSSPHAEIRDFMLYHDPCFVDDAQFYKTQLHYSMIVHNSSISDATNEYNMGNQTSYYIPYNFTVHGIQDAQIFLSCWNGNSCKYTLKYGGTSNNYPATRINNVSSSAGSNSWYDCGVTSWNSSKPTDCEAIYFKLYASAGNQLCVYGIFIQNQNDKKYIPNCIRGDIESNAGIGFLENYFVFCGDGDLYVKVRPKLSEAASIKFNTDGKATIITGQQTFYIEPSQLSNDYLQFTCKNIKLISAEITNRPYTVSTPATCSVSTTGNLSSTTSTATILTTYNDTPIKATFTVPAAGYIKFSDISNDDMSYYKNNETKYFTQGEKWKLIMFPRDAFRDNYNYKKLTYEMSGAIISVDKNETYMLNRAIRFDVGSTQYCSTKNAPNPPKVDTGMNYVSVGGGLYYSSPYWYIDSSKADNVRFYTSTDFCLPQRALMSFMKQTSTSAGVIRIGTISSYDKWQWGAFRFYGADLNSGWPVLDARSGNTDYAVNIWESENRLQMPVFVDPTGYCYNSEGKQEKYWDTIYGTTRTINYTGVYNSSMCSSSDTINAFTNNTIRYRSHYSKDKTYGNRCIYIHNCSVSGSYFWQYLIAMDLEQYWRQDKSTPVQVNYCTDTSVKIANNQMSLCYFVDKHKAFAATNSTDKAKVYISNTNGNGTISFYGKGDLYLMVKPQRSRVNGISLPRKAGAAQTVTVTIPPASETSWYTYEKQNNGTYKITLKLEYAQLTAVEYIRDKHPQYSKNITFTKPSVPNRSSVVDFSQNVSGKPVYDANLVVFGKDISGGVKDTTTYDSSLGYWITTAGNNNFYDKKPYAKGDAYFLMEDLSANLSTFDIWYGIDKQKASRWKYYLPGLTKLFFDADKMNPSNGFSSSGKHAFLVGGLTQPINAALYNYGVGKGVVTSTTSNYVNPGNDFNRTVLKKLTTDACTKLKAAGARVYVLKYRKQDKWKAFLRNETSAHSSQAITHSYTEIDACATSSGGKVYDIGTAADDTASNGTSANTTALKETLDAIAADIKSWAEYEEARNVTN